MDRLREMEMFVRVIEAGSFSAAARDLNMDQPAVSKTIAGLEDRLGVGLLTRSTRKLSPTEAGTAFYERALRAIGEANEAERRGLVRDWKAVYELPHRSRSRVCT
jgi:DNA-binding transcriptional LysR family regulator